MDVVVPGGVARDLAPTKRRGMRAPVRALEREIACCATSTTSTPACRTAFATAARSRRSWPPSSGSDRPRRARERHARRSALRLSGWRRTTTLGVRRAAHRDGDVAARVAVRFDEALESLRLIASIARRAARRRRSRAPLPPLRRIPARRSAASRAGAARCCIALESGPDGTIRRCHPHDPSWQNWPVLEHAVIGNIVPDFPLINKSFNLSYSGHDL